MRQEDIGKRTITNELAKSDDSINHSPDKDLTTAKLPEKNGNGLAENGAPPPVVLPPVAPASGERKDETVSMDSIEDEKQKNKESIQEEYQVDNIVPEYKPSVADNEKKPKER